MSVHREKLKQRIEENFEAMMDSLECIMNPFNPIKSMTVTGASGIGKSFNVIKRLKESHDSGLCNYHYLNGKCTTLGLYQEFYKARHLGSILLMDDVDVFDNEDKLNLLKAALETDDERIITYMSSSQVLRDNGIPTQFDFKGKVVFITNKDLVKISESKSALAPHVGALMTRGTFVDLQIHDNESIMIHIENVMRTTNIVKSLNISQDISDQILDFMMEHSDNLRMPSLRMPIQIAGYYMEHPTKWKRLAIRNCLKS
jgi:archaellum component FlaC